jgi:hypothetical protein
MGTYVWLNLLLLLLIAQPVLCVLYSIYMGSKAAKLKRKSLYYLLSKLAMRDNNLIAWGLLL